MTTWAYHVVRAQDEDGNDWFSIREVYLEDDGRVVSWAEKEAHPYGETWHELVGDLIRMGNSFDREVLDLTLDPPALTPRDNYKHQLHRHDPRVITRRD